MTNVAEEPSAEPPATGGDPPVPSPEEIADRVRRCLRHAPADRLSFAPDCGLSQTARWAARAKLKNMVAGVQLVRDELGVASAPLTRG